MLILVTYDVSTVDKEGQKRLRKVAKACQNYGQRVQNSVFECIIDAVQYVSLKHELAKIIDKKQDSLRFYRLGEKYNTKVEHIGTKETIDLEGPIVF